MSLIKLLNKRYEIAKSFTKKNFTEMAKQAIDDYEAKEPPYKKKDPTHNKHIKVNKYDITIPYIFATHESMVAAFFEKMPEIIVTGRTGENEEAAAMLKALYLYLEDMCDLDEFLALSSWWFFLVGFVVAHPDYKIEEKGETPLLDSQGQPMFDEMGEPVMIPTYSYHDPIVKVEDMCKIYFAPDSEFSIDGSKVPYYVTERLVETDEIEATYGVTVEADEKIEVEDYDDKDEDNSDLKRSKVKYYYGRLPKECEPDLMEFDIPWEYGKEYRVYYTKDKILYIESYEKMCKLARFYNVPNKFFGYGLGKTLKPFQDDMSVRRSQMLRYADLYAYPWLTVNGETKVDPKALQDVEKRKPLVFQGEKPEYLTPPDMPSIIQQADEAIRSDAQFVSGTLDLSKGAQETNTVKTATGQQLFAQSQDKRLQKARKSIAKYYREVVISLFKLCRDNWEEHKTITYTTEDGEETEVEISVEMLQQIDFDTDVDFNLDNVSVNEDIMSQRWISFLETAQNFDFVDVRKVFQKTAREAFKIQNAETFVKPPEEIAEEQAQQMQGQMPPEQEQTPQQLPQPPENPEEVAQGQLLGNALAPQPQYAGQMGV